MAEIVAFAKVGGRGGFDIKVDWFKFEKEGSYWELTAEDHLGRSP